MPDFTFSARNVVNDEFANEPGPAQFLLVPGRRNPKPDQAIPRDEWVAKLIEAATTGTDPITGQPTGSIVILVHGYNTSSASALQQQRQLQSDLTALGYKCVVVGFDWPSAQIAANYLEDRTDAKESALNLVSDGIALLSRAFRAGCRITVNVLAHSMGAFVVQEAFDDADDRPALTIVNWSVNQLCFIGADISSDSMAPGDPRSQSLYRHSIRITNYYNPYDAVLKLSNAKRVGMAPRLGRVGLPQVIPSKAIDVNCGPYFATLADVSGRYDAGYSHSFYIGNKLWTQDFIYTLEGNIAAALIPTRKIIDTSLSLWPAQQPSTPTSR